MGGRRARNQAEDAAKRSQEEAKALQRQQRKASEEAAQERERASRLFLRSIRARSGIIFEDSTPTAGLGSSRGGGL